MSADVVAAATSLRGVIEGARDRIESGRKLPDDVLEALSSEDLFRLSLPPETGPGADPVTSLRVYEELARADASVGWAVWNSSLPCLFGRFLDDDVRDRLFGEEGSRFASSTRPTGRAARENGGYRVRGRWSLVSGCQHADWIGLMCIVEEGGEPEILEGGAPHLRVAMIPAAEVSIEDTWHVGGLRGTGSHDVVLEGVEVEDARTFAPMDEVKLDAPIGRMPIAASMSAGHAALCLGVASEALDQVVALGRTKVSPDPVPALPDRASNQFAVAQAEATLAAFRGELHARTEETWRRARSEEAIDVAQVGRMWSSSVAAARASRRVIDELYEVAGTPALYEDFPLERAHRDMHAMLQHIIVQRMWAEDAGRVMFGLDPSNPLFML